MLELVVHEVTTWYQMVKSVRNIRGSEMKNVTDTPKPRLKVLRINKHFHEVSGLLGRLITKDTALYPTRLESSAISP
jgi:hypothetical protein